MAPIFCIRPAVRGTSCAADGGWRRAAPPSAGAAVLHGLGSAPRRLSGARAPFVRFPIGRAPQDPFPAPRASASYESVCCAAAASRQAGRRLQRGYKRAEGFDDQSGRGSKPRYSDSRKFALFDLSYAPRCQLQRDLTSVTLKKQLYSNKASFWRNLSCLGCVSTLPLSCGDNKILR